MTTIAWDGKILATDSGGSNGNLALGKEKKLYKVGDKLTATAGYVEDGFLFRRWLEEHDGDLDKFPPLEGSETLLITTDGAFVNWGKPALIPLTEPKATGTGGEYATSAMALGMSAIEAVIHACRLDVNSRGRVQFGYFDENGQIHMGELAYEGMDERTGSSGYFKDECASTPQGVERLPLPGHVRGQLSSDCNGA